MAESKAHQAAKKKAAGPRSSNETPLPGGRRLDAVTQRGAKATKIERSNNPENLKKAVQPFNDAEAKRAVLKVPQPNLDLAKEIATEAAKRPMTIENIGGTQRKIVRKRKRS